MMINTNKMILKQKKIASLIILLVFQENKEWRSQFLIMRYTIL